MIVLLVCAKGAMQSCSVQKCCVQVAVQWNISESVYVNIMHVLKILFSLFFGQLSYHKLLQRNVKTLVLI
jgi:hypothetical protein